MFETYLYYAGALIGTLALLTVGKAIKERNSINDTWIAYAFTYAFTTVIVLVVCILIGCVIYDKEKRDKSKYIDIYIDNKTRNIRKCDLPDIMKKITDSEYQANCDKLKYGDE